MLLDVQTLAIVAGLIGVGFGLCLPLSWRLARTIARLRPLTFGMALIGVGLFLLPINQPPSPAYLALIVNTMLLMGSYLLWYGLRCLLLPGPPPVLPGLLLLIANPALILYFTTLDPQYELRVMVNTASLVLIALAIIALLLKARSVSPPILWMMGLSHAAHISVLLIRLKQVMEEQAVFPVVQSGRVIDQILFTEVILLLFVTALCSVILVAEKLQQELLYQARTDPLTATLNRRGFAELAEREMLKTQRSGRPLALLVADIDHFKRLNDTYGHAAGDAVLKYFCALLLRALRQTDILARLGGEEFVIVLPETPVAEAIDVAERLRQMVQDTPMPFRDFMIPITISIGVAHYPSSATTLDNLQAYADSALYRAKKQGRNCVSHLPLAGVPHSTPLPRDADDDTAADDDEGDGRYALS